MDMSATAAGARRIDLRSDTVTRPGPGMRQAMAAAEVGDDVLDGDPTTGCLEARVAQLLGMDWALYVPTGTMGNQVAMGLVTKPGTELYLDALAHIVHTEMAGTALFWGVQIRPVTPRGLAIDADDVRGMLRPPGPHTLRASALAIENTHNSAGGVVTSVAGVRALAALARDHGLMVHLDGARLWNAAAALGCTVAELAAPVDTAMVSFSKGLGAPVGACVAGRGIPVALAREARRRFGGGMRQSGVVAAAALYGLDHNLARLPDDHAKARRFAAAVDGKGGARVIPPDTNIVMIDLAAGGDAAALATAIAGDGVLVSPWAASRLRAVMHLDAGDDEVAHAAHVVARHLARSAA